MLDMKREEQDLLLPSGAERELDVFRERLNTAYYPAFVDVRQARALPDARLNARRLTRSTVGFVRFGAPAVVDPGHIDGYHVNIAVAGRVGSEYGDQATVARPGVAAVFARSQRTRLPEWSADAAQICIKIDRTALHTELELILGREVRSDVAFDIALPTDGGAGRRFRETVLVLIDAVGGATDQSRVTGYLERAVISGLLNAARHNYRGELEDAGGRMLPLGVRRAKALIDDNPDALLTAGDLAAHAGVGVRRLEQAFQHHLGVSPTAYRLRVRLHHARADLEDPRDGDTVSGVMFRWGFSNHARFASAYRAQFGENPSETLSRNR